MGKHYKIVSLRTDGAVWETEVSGDFATNLAFSHAEAQSRHKASLRVIVYGRPQVVDPWVVFAELTPKTEEH